MFLSSPALQGGEGDESTVKFLSMTVGLHSTFTTTPSLLTIKYRTIC